MEAELSTPGIVVFSEMFYPGWWVYVDGVRRDVLCVDHAFRGVRVEPGKHEIEMRYRPLSLRIGAAVSAVSIVVWFLIAMGFLAKRRARGGP